MRLNREQVEANRKRVLAEAGRLFRERGFDGIGVAELMQAAGFTHGGFYNHFASKNELAALVAREITRKAAARLDRMCSKPERDANADYADYVAHYLSLETRDIPGQTCPIAALGPDVVRQDVEVKKAFAEGLEDYLKSLAAAMPPKEAGTQTEDRRGDAITALATMLGGIVLARSVSPGDEEFSREILDTVRDNLLKDGKPAKDTRA